MKIIIIFLCIVALIIFLGYITVKLEEEEMKKYLHEKMEEKNNN